MFLSSTVYSDLAARCARIDARNTRYRFDLERDIPWHALDEPGAFFPTEVLEELTGIGGAPLDARARDLLGWAAAYALTEEILVREEDVIRFVACETRAHGLGRSAALLHDEEQKHGEMFRRWRDHLAPRHPGLAARLSVLAARARPFWGRALDTARYPSEVVRHYIGWLTTVYFEEVTISLADLLSASAEPLQPAWLATHLAHRGEEAQHVVTDATHIEALALTADERFAWSKTFVLEELGEAGRSPFRAIAGLLHELYPELAWPRRTARPGANRFEALLTHPAFKRTRAAAPYLQLLAAEH